MTASLKPIPLEPLPAQPRVSVLVSNYNYGLFLEEAIESVLGQSYPHFELIVCDDGSTDNSREIVAHFGRRDARVRLVAKPNGGQASGFNSAFAASRGALLFLFDSDDVLRPHKLEAMVEAHRLRPEAGFGVHRVQRVNKRRRPQGVWPLASVLPSGWHGERMLENGGVLSYMPPTSGLSLHRAVAERIFPLPESYPLTAVADQVITRLAPLLTAVVANPEVLAEHRLHDANSYGRHRVTAATIGREIDTCRSLWGAQHAFLAGIDPELARRLQPLEQSSYLIYLEYLHARLSRSDRAQSTYARYLRDIESNPEARRVWFWKYSIYLPASLFNSVVNLMSRQSALKQLLARLQGVT